MSATDANEGRFAAGLTFKNYSSGASIVNWDSGNLTASVPFGQTACFGFAAETTADSGLNQLLWAASFNGSQVASLSSHVFVCEGLPVLFKSLPTPSVLLSDQARFLVSVFNQGDGALFDIFIDETNMTDALKV